MYVGVIPKAIDGSGNVRCVPHVCGGDPFS